ncbi:MAG: Rrf2 family transcriptional regulator [Ilumatobacteraceae bacterium]
MRLGEPVEWALHCVVVLAGLPPGQALPASRLAEFHGVPPAYLAKAMQALSRSGLVETAPGRRGGYRLARPAARITMLDVVLAVDGDAPAFRCQEIRKRGPIQAAHYTPMCSIAAVMQRAERAWRTELAAVTMADIAQGLVRSLSKAVRVRNAAWVDYATGGRG